MPAPPALSFVAAAGLILAFFAGIYGGTCVYVFVSAVLDTMAVDEVMMMMVKCAVTCLVSLVVICVLAIVALSTVNLEVPIEPLVRAAADGLADVQLPTHLVFEFKLEHPRHVPGRDALSDGRVPRASE